MSIQWNNEDYLAHYGVPRRSGRYKWGSGKDPYHHGASAPRGERRKTRKEQRIARKMDKRIAMNTKAMNKHDAKLVKNYNKGKWGIENEKSLQLERKFWKSGYEDTNKLYRQYKDMKIKSITDKDIKRTREYNLLRRKYGRIRITEVATYMFAPVPPLVKEGVASDVARQNSARRIGAQNIKKHLR